jgi:hypothetical protein
MTSCKVVVTLRYSEGSSYDPEGLAIWARAFGVPQDDIAYSGQED